MDNNRSLLKAQSPAALAEEYIVKSIWNNHFPPGSGLPAERELADKIGVTRTTLREVLQRLARDGWLSIQHGKATKVNNIWETSGLNILEVLVRLDETKLPTILSNILSARTNLAEIYMKKAFKIAKEASLSLFQPLKELENTAKAYTEFDYNLFRQLAFNSDNPVYGLILNSFKHLYMRVGMVYFSSLEAQALAYRFYSSLQELCEQQRLDEVVAVIRQYGKESGMIWAKMQESMPQGLSEQV